MDIEYPLYGKRGNPPISPEQWWTELIRRCVKEAGADQAGKSRLAIQYKKVADMQSWHSMEI